MNSLAAIAVNQAESMSEHAATIAPSIDESRAKIYAMLGAASQGGLIWSGLSTEQRRIFCFAAGLKQSHVEKKLSDFDDLERHKLLRAIKSIGHTAKKFNSVLLQDFK